MRRNTAYFAALAEEMAKAPGVAAVRVNPIACSLLVHCDPDTTPDVIAQFAAKEELFVLEAPQSPLLTVVAKAFAGIQAIDRKLKVPGSDRYDKRALLLLVLVALAIRQTLRGEIMAPAVTLWWNAYGLLGQMGSSPATSATSEQHPTEGGHE